MQQGLRRRRRHFRLGRRRPKRNGLRQVLSGDHESHRQRLRSRKSPPTGENGCPPRYTIAPASQNCIYLPPFFFQLLSKERRRHVEKIKVTNMCYMAACGLDPERTNGELEGAGGEHVAVALVKFAVDMIAALKQINRDGFDCKLRIGKIRPLKNNLKVKSYRYFERSRHGGSRGVEEALLRHLGRHRQPGVEDGLDGALGPHPNHRKHGPNPSAERHPVRVQGAHLR